MLCSYLVYHCIVRYYITWYCLGFSCSFVSHYYTFPQESTVDVSRLTSDCLGSKPDVSTESSTVLSPPPLSPDRHRHCHSLPPKPPEPLPRPEGNQGGASRGGHARARALACGHAHATVRLRACGGHTCELIARAARASAWRGAVGPSAHFARTLCRDRYGPWPASRRQSATSCLFKSKASGALKICQSLLRCQTRTVLHIRTMCDFYRS
jgi:hypothetical protein